MEADNRIDESLLGKAVVLGSMVEYQSGAVVSRTVIDRPGGTVTLFSFDKDQGLSEHTAPFNALVYLIDGKAVITINGVNNCLQAGEGIIMPANQPHALTATEKFKMMLVMIRDV